MECTKVYVRFAEEKDYRIFFHNEKEMKMYFPSFWKKKNKETFEEFRKRTFKRFKRIASVIERTYIDGDRQVSNEITFIPLRDLTFWEKFWLGIAIFFSILIIIFSLIPIII